MLSRKISRNRIKKYSKTKKYLGKGGSRGSIGTRGASLQFPEVPYNLLSPPVSLFDPSLRKLFDDCNEARQLILEKTKIIKENEIKLKEAKYLSEQLCNIRENAETVIFKTEGYAKGRKILQETYNTKHNKI